MVSIFKSNHPAVIFLLLCYLLLVRAIFIVAPETLNFPVSNNYLGGIIFHFIEIVSSGKPLLTYLMATALVFFQAVYFNYLINHFRILSKSSFLPAMSFILVSSFFNEFLILSPALIANTFILLALGKVLAIYKKEKALALIFDAALLISIGSLIYFPYVFFYLFLLASLIILRPFNFREYIISLLGALAPYYFMLVYFFWNNKLDEFLISIQIKVLSFSFQQIKFSPQVITISVVVVLVILWALFFIQANIFKMLVQVRSYLMIFILMFLAGFFSMLIQFDGRFDHFLWIVYPVALAFSMYFLEARRKWISEIVQLFLILTILFYQYNFLLN